ncbi:hypothetical protein LR48_Vigan09g079200 [Vigna angularis]|uniref:Uncharacterized protein n=1 Tax=Phaseolus angularis TaxID=3914 RepID=A0A0L9VAV3_PHAAN|nr:hypothetical protein LR48_Vigan09g079200 [Vigna angularis]
MHHATCSDPPPSRACAPLVKVKVSEVNGGVQVSSRRTISIPPPSLLNPSPSLFCNLPPLSPFTFQSRRNVRPAVIFLLDRTEFGSELNVVRGRTKTLHWGVHCYPDGEALLEETLEEEVLEDASLVDVEVKVEP